MTDRLLFFVSSSMSELPDERVAVQRAVGGVESDPFLNENDAHAAIGTAREEPEAELARSEAMIDILDRKLGDYTECEIERARKMSTPILLHRKVDEEEVIEVDREALPLELENVETGVSARYFHEASELETFVAHHVRNLLRGSGERLTEIEYRNREPGGRTSGADNG